MDKLICMCSQCKGGKFLTKRSILQHITEDRQQGKVEKWHTDFFPFIEETELKKKVIFFMYNILNFKIKYCQINFWSTYLL